MFNDLSLPAHPAPDPPLGKPRDLGEPGRCRAAPRDPRDRDAHAGSRQAPPWRFVPSRRTSATPSPPAAARLPGRKSRAEPDGAGGGRRFARQAPELIVALSRPTPGQIQVWEQSCPAALPVMNLHLGAHALGYVAGLVTGWALFGRSARRLRRAAGADRRLRLPRHAGRGARGTAAARFRRGRQRMGRRPPADLAPFAPVTIDTKRNCRGIGRAQGRPGREHSYRRQESVMTKTAFVILGAIVTAMASGPAIAQDNTVRTISYGDLDLRAAPAAPARPAHQQRRAQRAYAPGDRPRRRRGGAPLPRRDPRFGGRRPARRRGHRGRPRVALSRHLRRTGRAALDPSAASAVRVGTIPDQPGSGRFRLDPDGVWDTITA